MSFTAPKRPSHIPAPPEPWIYVGTAPFPNGGKVYRMSAWTRTDPTWLPSDYSGTHTKLHYAVLPGSPAALALGIEEPCKPEPVDNGGSAFPQMMHSAAKGMSLRDWFAGMALSSMTTAPDYSKGPCNQAMADRAYVIADAMLAARKGGTSP